MKEMEGTVAPRWFRAGPWWRARDKSSRGGKARWSSVTDAEK